MTKLWLKTKRGHIIDLNFVSYLYQTDHAGNEVYAVLSDAIPTHIRIGLFDTKEEAQQYLDEIFDLLTFAKEKKRMEDAREDLEKLLAEQDVLFRCDECKKYPTLEP